MPTAKEEVRRILEQIPDDASLDDIQYHIYVQQKVSQGLRDLAEGKTLDHEEVERRASKWLDGSGGPKPRGATSSR